MALAKLFVKRDAPRAAVDLLAEILSVYPADLDALAMLGRALVKDDRVDEALQVFQRWVAYDDTSVEAFFHLGVALARKRHFAQAVAAWERVVALEPSSPAARRARRHIRSAADLKQIFSHEAA